MKIYISADIEGITGVTSWDETIKNNEDYISSVYQMQREVNAACEGANQAGAKEIFIQDAHESGRNMDPSIFPINTKFIKGWSGHPFSMIQGLDESFDAVIFIGYHSGSGSSKSPLSHTMHPDNIQSIKINNIDASEFLIHAYAAATLGVPVVFVSGDEGLCKEVKKINSNIDTLAVKKGLGASTISIHNNSSVNLIRTKVEKVLNGSMNLCCLDLPDHFKVEITYTYHHLAYKNSFYPGMKLIGSNKVVFETNDYFEVLRMIAFVV